MTHSSPAFETKADITKFKAAWLQRIAGDRRVTSGGKSLAIVFCTAFPLDEETGVWWPGLNTLTKLLNTGRQSVLNARGNLAACGYLMVETGGGAGKTTRCRPVLPAGNCPVGWTVSEPKTVQFRAKKLSSGLDPNPSKKNPKISLSCAREDDFDDPRPDEAVAALLPTFPRRSGYFPEAREVRQAFDKAIADGATTESLTAAARAEAAYWARKIAKDGPDEAGYIPKLENWLGKGGWKNPRPDVEPPDKPNVETGKIFVACDDPQWPELAARYPLGPPTRERDGVKGWDFPPDWLGLAPAPPPARPAKPRRMGIVESFASILADVP